MKMKTQHAELYGLVLAGGKSRRMRCDKAQLEYHGKAQFIHAVELLTPFCREVFISLRPEQAAQMEYQSWPAITDDPMFANIGPLAGILSAMKRFPEQAWFVLACDLPFVTSAIIGDLVKHRKSAQPVSAYKSANDDLPEPVCAIYEPAVFTRLIDFQKNGIFCPRQIISQLNVCLFDLPQAESLSNANTPEEYVHLKSRLAKDVQRERREAERSR